MKRIFSLFLAGCLLLAILPGHARAAGPTVAAKSAVLMDMTTGTVLIEQNAHAPLAPASVTKVMTMLLIMEAIDSGKIGWTDTVTASETAAGKGGSQIYLKVGETMSVTDLVRSIAVSSANDAACAMAEHIAGSEAAFVEAMNRRARELGMENTLFANCTGLDDEADVTRHYTSAYDIALMSRELMLHHPDIQQYTTIWMDSIRGGTFGLANTNKLIRFYPGATGLKTGFTSAAGFCLSATAEREGMGLIAVVMGAETSKERFAACKALLDYGFANYALTEPQLPDNCTVPVKLGHAGSVSAAPSADGRQLIDKAQKNSVTTELTLEPTVTAPVSKGQKLGTLTLRAGDRILCRIPMLAQEAVPRLTWSDLLAKVLRYLTMGREG
ncbi:MAG: D-alanyl-D-alanine carboxypeptidase [Ruminococcaceae bacterium]|nr:D-alanyl-D-alanine carboxypeptidase [Oscillospiraceae bacterium]